MGTTGTTQRETLAGEGALPTLFKSEARATIIEAFVTNRNRELNVSDIARLSDTSRTTVYEQLERLTELGIVEEVEVGGTTRYTLNNDDELANTLYKLQGLTLHRLFELDDDVEL
ncbi:Sugar-specific transcriptional regulator TrmB [Halorubrum aquaticum]|jgi:Fe2+ or Zn2+ uptake regulation protein|uniref:Sugar-specific transcriptional regulator TrmB n=1 Tax=Halorubrum aquaticum TaxID=387340 RepID=A0A1I3AJN6_9EURY|nr:winged helix-turn-helix domain-containing protein [Halorubrum aquaticum]SFH49969.1 Sugar-specific transcriptional regulator TrmB [Halorubrum aquaticum]